MDNIQLAHWICNRQKSDKQLCDGSPVPEVYTALIALIGATLPDLEPEDNRLAYYIYGKET